MCFFSKFEVSYVPTLYLQYIVFACPFSTLRAFTIFGHFCSSRLVFPEQQKATLHPSKPIPIHSRSHVPFCTSSFICIAKMWRLSGMIGNSGWKAGSWLLFHRPPHHNTPVTHPIACLGHSWGCTTWLHLILLEFSLSPWRVILFHHYKHYSVHEWQ